MTPLRIGLLGFGTVGSSVARILVERPELAGRVQLTHVFNRDVQRKRASWVPSSVTWTEDVTELLAAKPDVVVEVIGGVDPVGGWVRRALQQGAAVVTANKQLLAAQGPELLHLALTNKTQLRFEASVGGGVPLIHGVREGLAGDNLKGVQGILNGTSNYILSRMAHSDEQMAPVLEDARRLGYAEADPSADIDGVSMVEAKDDGFHAFVGPALVLRGSNFGLNMGANNVVTIVGQYGGKSTFSGAGAGGPATAVAVVSDLLALTQRHRDHTKERHEGVPADGEEWIPGNVVPPPARPYYLRFVVKDRPGIVASIAASLAAQGINLDSMLQEPGHDKDALPFVMTVEACEEAALGTALQEIAAAEYHAEPPLALPILLGEDPRT
jgi:homoserine dehydrogenase